MPTSSAPSEATVAVIVDIVGSRTLDDRATAQSSIETTFRSLDGMVDAVQPLRATVGDEFQGVYPDLDTALLATLLARLMLPPGIDCRFGLGLGPVHVVGDAEGGVQDGPGWWNARLAIEEAHRGEDGRTPTSRSWYRSDVHTAGRGSEETGRAAEQHPGDPREPYVNAYLLARDHLVGSMSSRARTLTMGTLAGRSQRQLAEDEGISQSAVSQSLRRSGGSALVSGLAVIANAGRTGGGRS